MSDVKELTVSLQPQDEKALSRSRTRRRRRNAGMLGGESEPAPMEVVKTSIADTAKPIAAEPVVLAQPTIPVMTVTPTIITPIPPLATTTAVGGGVTLQAKKVDTPAPRIIPHKKRVSGAAATSTLKKAKFVVTPAPHPLLAKPRAEGGKSRVFSERKISITMRPSSSTRRMRRTLKAKIAAMPTPTVKRMLLRKGVLKPKATAPPEDMMRSMLRDYMLLHAAE